MHPLKRHALACFVCRVATLFSKILIANRGEIACRIMRTARAMGVRTVAVYSDADTSAMHVVMADEAVRLGPSPASESYLRGDLVIKAALQTGAQAIHPGYGFLSENPQFVDDVVAAGLRFIGPSADAIRAMGLKDAAKVLMEKAGVPVVPGYHGENQDSTFLAQQAANIGYPVLIKARAGGGGKGMRRVNEAAEFAAALEGAQREAQASFGDACCLIEKYVATPRHIEIQVFGDDHGNVVHLFERDCSLQRRHQKVIEEAPAPGMTPAMRDAMGEAAVKACQAISYSGAGTIEFIVDSTDGLRTDGFWFMEMNTRLQVEHPVTEAITGQDLVEWQLQVAAGNPLPLTQSELTINGWAFEARIYAEDVTRGFLPATGTLSYLQFCDVSRIDTGIRQGDTITPYYDPMIAKLTVHAPTRDSALKKMGLALRDTHAAGSTTNINFLAALCAQSEFVEGQVDTGLIEREIDLLADDQAAPTAVVAMAAIGVAGLAADNPSMTGFCLWEPIPQTIALLSPNGEAIDVSLTVIDPQTFSVRVGSTTHRVVIRDATKGNVEVDGVVTTARIVAGQDLVSVFADKSYHFDIPDPLAQSIDTGAGGDGVSAPMPGQVKVVNVEAGDNVSLGESLIVLEAMKMEHTLVAPRDGVVLEVYASTCDQVEDGALLLSLEPEDKDKSAE